MNLRPVSTSVFYGVILLGLLAMVFCLNFRSIQNGRHARQQPTMQGCHVIGLALYSYANDHDGNYPAGANSAQVFQLLVDGGYVTEPAIFYLPMPGKSAAKSGQKLKPENVCWDFTAGATMRSPGVLPLIFSTGYRVTYAPGAGAFPLIKLFPEYFAPVRTWAEWWNGESAQNDMPGIAAFYIDNSAKYNVHTAAGGDGGSVPKFISPEFVPVGESYRQLTPEGVLP